MGAKGATTTQNTNTLSNTNSATNNGYNNSATGAYNPYGSSYLTSALNSAQPGVLGAVGTANPYFQTASNLYNASTATPDVSAYFNPLAGAVTSQLNNVFGQQASQNTGQLTQAAGGVGADRIAVGQSELANQQGLAAGQTLAGLYQPALGAAQTGQALQQSAASGQAGLGTASLNAALAPYTALSGITGQLAPQLGGQTSNQGTGTGYGNTVGQTQATGTTNTTVPGPTLLSQILGGGTALAGILGGTGGLSGLLGGLGSKGSGLPLTSQPSPNGPDSYAVGYGAARGGRISPYGYDNGGSVNPMMEMIDLSDMDARRPQGAPNQPAPAQAPPVKFLPPPQQQSGSSGGVSGSDIASAAMKILPLLMAKRGGRIDPKKFDGANPYAFADGGSPDDAIDASDIVLPTGSGGYGAGQPWSPSNPAIAADAGLPPSAMGYADVGGGSGGIAPRAANPYSASPAGPQDGLPVAAPSGRDPGFAGSPWAALTAAGLGMLASRSPFAGVAIGEGGLQGLKTLEQQRGASQKDETIDQAARRLDQEAQFHQDQYTKSTPYQQFEMRKPVPIGQRLDPQTGLPMTTYGIPQPDGSVKPIQPTPGDAGEVDPNAVLPPGARATAGLVPGKDIPANADPSVLASVDVGLANTVRAIDEGRASLATVPMRQRYAVERLLNAYDPGFDQTTWGARNRQQSDMTTNGNAGKLVLAVNQLLPHLQTASEKAAALDNGNYPAANAIQNWVATAMGDPRVKQFETVREVASMDAARLLRGSGQMAEKDIEHWRDTLNTAGSPAQLQGVISELGDDLIGARVGSIQQGYRSVMGKEPPQLVSDEATAALAKIKQRAAAVAQPGQRSSVARPAAAAPPQGADPLAQARAAIANGAPRDAVIQRLRQNGIDPSGL